MQIFKTFEEKKLYLRKSKDEACIIKAKLNLITKKLTVKVYFRNVIVSKYKFKVDSEFRYRVIDFLNDEKATELTELWVFLDGVKYYDNTGNHKLWDFFHVFDAERNVEKIIANEKIKKL